MIMQPDPPVGICSIFQHLLGMQPEQMLEYRADAVVIMVDR
jgi:hypothetical protein